MDIEKFAEEIGLKTGDNKPGIYRSQGEASGITSNDLRLLARKARAEALEEAEAACKKISDKYAFGHYGDEVDAVDECRSAINALKSWRPSEQAELAETAMRFVDRAGDPHPGIDDAETICREFYEAMSEVILRHHPMPHHFRNKSKVEQELEAMHRYIAKITKDKSSAVGFLSRAGIIDANGELAEQFRNIIEKKT